MPGPNVSPVGYAAGNQMFQSGMDGMNEALDSYRKRVQNRAISQLMQEPTEAGMTPVQANQSMVQRLMGVGGIDPATALGLANANSESAYKQMAYDKGQYGLQADDLGNVFKYNKNTGEVETQQGGYNMYNSPKNQVSTVVTGRDGSGMETPQVMRYPKYVDPNSNNFDFSGPDAGYEQPNGTRQDAQGNTIFTPPPVLDGNATTTANTLPVGTKLPKTTEAESKVSSAVSTAVGPMTRIKETYHKDFVGPFDARWQGTKSNFGQGDANFNTFQGNLRQLTNITRHELFGGALTEQEIAEWNRAAPVDRQNETEFVPKYNSFVDLSIDKAGIAAKRHAERGDYAKAAELKSMQKQLQESKINVTEEQEQKGSKYGNDYTIISF